MNYNKFCQHEAPIHMLTKKEIGHPYLVLDDLCNKRTMEVFQQELENFLSIFFKEGGWKKHDPGMLYETYKDLVRLVDVLYLIDKYSPMLSSIRSGKADPGPQTKMKALSRIFREGKKEGADNDETQTVLNYFYNSCHIGFLKVDLNYCLQVVLNASFMRNSKYEYFGFEHTDFLVNLHRLEGLISEGYAIYGKGRSVFPVLESCPELAFAKDKNHPTHLLYECLSKPMGTIDHYYDYYLSANHIHRGLKAWKNMLFVSDFWKGEESPGNLIHLHDCISTLIDVFWLSDKKELLEAISFDYSEISKEAKAIAKRCSKVEKRSPLLTIRSFFAFKSLHQWKALLDEWLKYSLSNTISYTEEQKGEVKKSFNILIKFMEATYLIGQTSELRARSF